MTSNIMLNMEKLSGSFLSLLLSVMQATMTKMILHPSCENTKFNNNDSCLGTTFSSSVLPSPFGGANVVNGGIYLKTASNFSDTYHIPENSM